MSTFGKENVKCAVCGQESEFSFTLSSNQLGAPDLDMRPPEMLRSTLFTWVQRCPRCGYCAEDISVDAGIERNELFTTQYKECDFAFIVSDLAKTFYRAALLYRSHGDHKRAYRNFLRAAWCEDDQRSEMSATTCRERAAEELDIVLSGDMKKKGELILLMADILRRSGRCDELIERYGELKMEDSIHQQILDYQLKRAKLYDKEVHLLFDAVPYPGSPGSKK